MDGSSLPLSHNKSDYESINSPESDDGNRYLNLKQYFWENAKEVFCAKLPKYFCDHTYRSCSCRSILCCGKNADYYYNQLTSKEDLRKILKFHFKSPFEKWNSDEHRRFPWKLLMQIICIILVTLQLIFFARTKFFVTDFLNENSRTFSRLFVVNPVDDTSQTDPIPSPIAYLYTMDEVLEQINFTASAYLDLQNRAVGTYGFEWIDSDHQSNNDTEVVRHLTLIVTKYANGRMDPTYLNVGVKEQDVDKYYIYEDDLHSPNRSITDAIMWSNLTKEINLIEEFGMEFKISSVSIVDGSTDDPRCFQFTLLMTIRRDYDGGNMPLTLKIHQILTRDCRNGSAILEFDTSFEPSKEKIAVDGLVIIFSMIFIILSVRSLINTLQLACRIAQFLLSRMNNFHLKILKPLFSIWHITVILSNILAVIGSILKLMLSLNVINDIHVVDGTSIVLGLAVFGQWCGLLRFLGYFDKYNMLLRTLKVAAPNVGRFIICTGILYIAFLLCGWLVMGPYHPKFRSFTLSSECLFSLINGDDMFNTYTMASNSPKPVFIFSKIYLYVFVALFIYVVLSVFISLIEDTYRTLHDEWLEHKKEQSSVASADEVPVTSKFLYKLRDDEGDKIRLRQLSGGDVIANESTV